MPRLMSSNIKFSQVKTDFSTCVIDGNNKLYCSGR